jgi:hypothetical protein
MGPLTNYRSAPGSTSSTQLRQQFCRTFSPPGLALKRQISRQLRICLWIPIAAGTDVLYSVRPSSSSYSSQCESRLERLLAIFSAW